MTTTQTPLTEAQATYNGRTLHLRSRSRSRGTCEQAEIREHDAKTGCFLVVDTASRVMAWYFPEEIHLTAADRDATCRALRKPRQARTPQPLYGDFAALAMFHGISTDGTGRVARRSAR